MRSTFFRQFKIQTLVLIFFLWTAHCLPAQSLGLTPPQQAKFAASVLTDPKAKSLFERKYKAEADAALNASPNPARQLEEEGKLDGESVKAQTRHSLEDMNKLTVLTDSWLILQDAKYRDKAKEFLLAWTTQNEPSGNPINETALEPIIRAYDQFHASFSVAETKQVESWLQKIVVQEKRGAAQRPQTAFNNWNSHRLKILGLIALTLQDQALLNEVVASFKIHVSKNLFPDGSSFDYHHRDALHYHCYDLEPLLTLAVAVHQKGIDLYNYEAPNGASLRKSVAFLVPFCDGTQTHPEWVHSEEPFDLKRAEAGEPDYKAGTLFNPEKATKTFVLAATFDKAMLPLAFKVAGSRSAAFVEWQSLLNSVRD